jgi:prolyl oligopeptidase
MEIPLEIGSVDDFTGKRKDDEFFFNFVSFLTPGKAYRVDLSKQPFEVKLFREVKAEGFDPSDFVTKQVFYASKDGTKIPMFIVHKKVLFVSLPPT